MPIDEIKISEEMPGFGERAALILPRRKEEKPKKSSRLPLEAGKIYSEFDNKPEIEDVPKDPMERENLRNEIKGLEDKLFFDDGGYDSPEEQKPVFDDPEMAEKAKNLSPEEAAKFWQHVAGLYADLVKKGKWEAPPAVAAAPEKPDRKKLVAEALKDIVTDEAELADILKRIE